LGHNDRKIDPKYFLQPVKNTGMLAGTKPAIPQVDPVRKKPAPRAEKTPVKPEPAKKTADLADTIQRFTPRNILFEQSKSVMLQGSLAELDNLADMLQRHPVLKVSVEGHTDNIGDLVKNQKLSEERAAAVAVYLVHKGIAPERVSSRGYGSSRSLTSDPSPEGHMKNRRVEFVIR
jgi:outer membrane protein OmpA-like peptidoglycan-associated protein